MISRAKVIYAIVASVLPTAAHLTTCYLKGEPPSPVALPIMIVLGALTFSVLFFQPEIDRWVRRLRAKGKK